MSRRVGPGAPWGPVPGGILGGQPAPPIGLPQRHRGASQGEGGTPWRAGLAGSDVAPVDLGGYEFNADGMLLDGDLLYGVTNRGEDIEDLRFMISVAELAPGWRSAAIVAELTGPGWDCPTTPGRRGPQTAHRLLPGPREAHQDPPRLPFEIAATDLLHLS